MKKNWRGEPAIFCWMCGSADTCNIDPTTRECKQCGNWYAVFEEPDDRPDPAPGEAETVQTPKT